MSTTPNGATAGGPGIAFPLDDEERARRPPTPRAPELGLELTAEQVEAQLRGLIAHERVERLELERKLTDVRERERRYERALAAMQPAPPAKSPAKSSARRGDGSWNISQEKIEEVYRRFVELREQHPNEALSPGRIARLTPGLSPETARRALYELRDQERLRISGKVRGGGTKWDLMPEPANGA